MKPSLEIPRCIKLKILSLKLFILFLELLILLNKIQRILRVLALTPSLAIY